jgi:hypothetical protein
MDDMGLVLPLVYSVECRDADGRLKWRERIHNLVTTEGKNSLGNVYFRASAQITAWFVGLKNTGTIAASDTAATHGGWAEFTSYSEATREALTLAAFSSGTSTNTASPAVFTISGSGTVAGAFVASVSAKSSGSGVLYSVADFSSPQTVVATDEITVTVTVT